MPEAQHPGKASHFESLYIHWLYALAYAVRLTCDQLFAATPPPKPGQGYIRVDPAVMALIESALLSGANIKKLLHPPKERGSSESAKAYAVRIRRTASLLAAIGGLPTDEIRNTQARNALEHLDEKLDELNARLESGINKLGDTVVFNMILSSGRLLDQFNIGVQYPLLVYVADERQVRTMTYRVDMQALRNEAAAIEDRLKTVVTSFEADGRDGPGGLMIILRKPGAAPEGAK